MTARRASSAAMGTAVSAMKACSPEAPASVPAPRVCTSADQRTPELAVPAQPDRAVHVALQRQVHALGRDAAVGQGRP